MMNETGGNRTDLWLPVAATVVIFRVLILLVEMVTSTLSVILGRVPFLFSQHVRVAASVLAPVMAVALAVLIARAIEPRMMQIERKKKDILLIVLVVLAILPWQLQIKTTTRAVMRDEIPQDARREMELQPTPGGDSSTRANAGLGTPQE